MIFSHLPGVELTDKNVDFSDISFSKQPPGSLFFNYKIDVYTHHRNILAKVHISVLQQVQVVIIVH